MTRYKLVDTFYPSNQLYRDNNTKNPPTNNNNQEERVVCSQTPSPTSSLSPVNSSPSSPTDNSSSSSSTSSSPARTTNIEIQEETDFQKLVLFKLVKELMENIENKKNQSIPPDLVESLISELSSYSNKSINKKGTKKKRERGCVRVCHKCGTDSTPEWRRSPEGSTTLCNACGLKEKKRAKISSNNASGNYYGPGKFHHSNYHYNNTNATYSRAQVTSPGPNYNLSYTAPTQHQSSRSPMPPFQSYRNQDLSHYNVRVPLPSQSTAAPPLYYPVSDSPYYFPSGPHRSQSSSYVESPECTRPGCFCMMNYYDMPSVFQQDPLV